jgi:hypothetical protein
MDGMFMGGVCTVPTVLSSGSVTVGLPVTGAEVPAGVRVWMR